LGASRHARGPMSDDVRQTGKATLVGEVHLMQQRTEHMGEDSSRTIWSFRLVRYDPGGNALRPVPVEMRGIAFEGSLAEGDQVRVAGRWRGGTLRAEQLENLTTGALVRAKSYKGLMIAALVVFLIFAGLIAWWAIDSSNDFDRRSEQNQQLFEQRSEEMQRQFCEDAAAMGQTPPSC
jgi:hypothetical protein